MPRSRPARLKDGKRRLEEELEVERRANAEYEAYRTRGVMKDGRRFGRPPTPYRPPGTPAGKVNLSDPDSRNVKTPRGYMQGYNALRDRRALLARHRAPLPRGRRLPRDHGEPRARSCDDRALTASTPTCSV